MRRPERRLEDSEALYEAVLADAPFGIVLVNQDLRLAEVNEAFCRMLGFKREELTGIPISEITHPEDVDRDLRNAQKLLAGEIPNYRLEKRYLTKNREVIWAILTAASIRDREGNLLYGICII